MHISSLYRLTRWIARVALTVYFRKVEAAGLKHVPGEGPVILAANHPQSVTDAIILATTCPRMVCYLAHSGLFRNRVQAWILRQLGVIPVYRREDIVDAADRNTDMFRACHEIMHRRGVIGVFPEGTSADEQRVQRLKTGTARIALQSEEQAGWSLGVRIVPVGLNFESKRRFRTRVLVRFGAPVAVATYEESFTDDPVTTVNTLTESLGQSIRGIVINIEHSEFEELVRDLELVYKDELLAREGLDLPGDTAFKRDQWVSRELPRALDYFLKRRPELIWRVRLMLREYRNRLERLRIKDEHLRNERGASIPGAAARFVVWGALGLPFAAYGGLWNSLPYKLTGWLADRQAPDATKVHYYRLRTGAPIYLVYYGALLYFAFRVLGGVGVVLFALSLPLTGLFARVYASRMERRRGRIRIGFLELRHGFHLKTLRQQRRRLIKELDAAAGHYASAMALSTPRAPVKDASDPPLDNAGRS